MIYALLSLAALAVLAPSDTPDSGSSTLFLHPERIPLREGGFVSVERGMLLVPIVRADPASKQIAVEVYRFRAAEGAPQGVPPIFQLYGGPGWPGLESVLEEPGGYEQEILPMTQVADLVVIGQRGIGSSKPDTVCAGTPEAPRGVDPTPEQEAEALRQACADCRSYWEGEGYDLRGLNVIEAAADVDDVRRLLGYDKITIWGGSFGSHWGMAVLRYHPEGVARAVLTGMEGPDHTYDMPSGVLAALELIAGAAEVSPELAGQIPEGGLIQAFKTVIARVEEEPVEVKLPGETVRFDADAVRDLAQGYTSRVSSRRGVPSWPADVLALYAGDFDRAARAAAGDGDGGGLPTASFFMLDCGSGITPARLAQLQADPAAAVVGDLGRWYQTTCPAWGADLGDEFRAGFNTDVPTVIVHGTWDVNTPFDNALECLPFFSNAKFVIVDGGSHGALREAMGFSADFRSALMGFVAAGDASAIPDVVEMPPIAWARPY